jgi:hypothetical protein
MQMPWHPGDVEGLVVTANRLRVCRRRPSLPFQCGGSSSICPRILTESGDLCKTSIPGIPTVFVASKTVGHIVDHSSCGGSSPTGYTHLLLRRLFLLVYSILLPTLFFRSIHLFSRMCAFNTNIYT